MKKRIISAALAAVLMFGIATDFKRAAAASGGAVIAIATLGTLAWQLIGVMTGQYDETAKAIGTFIESGVDGITNSDSPFQQNWRTGWESICDTVSGWVDSGAATFDSDGNLHMDYNQYMDLYGKVVSVIGKPSVEFDAKYDYTFLDADFSTPTSFSSLPRIDSFFYAGGQSYAPVYYNDDMIVFGSGYLAQRGYNTSGYDLQAVDLKSFNSSDLVWGGSYIADSYSSLISNIQPLFSFSYNHLFFQETDGYTRQASRELSACYVFKDGCLIPTSISDIDFAVLRSGVITTSADYSGFLKSLTGFSVSTIAPELDDLSDSLPLDSTSNPGLIISGDPSIVLPTDAVTVTGVPGIADTALTNYMTSISTDIDIPSIIVEKFPFCIPYDFIRIISVLCADPVPPVFRIPISTNPDNFQGFEGNQTLGEYLPDEDFKPMFELDEEIVIDLSVLPLVQPISYTIFILGFIVLLIMLTPKLIHH